MKINLLTIATALFLSLVSLAQENKTELDVKFTQALNLQKKSRRVEAENIYNEILKVDRTYGAAYYQRSLIHLHYKKNDVAQKDLAAAIDFGNTETKISAHKEILTILFKDNDSCSADAMTHVNALSSLESDNFESSYYSGLCKFHSGNFQEAVNDFTQAYNQNPEFLKILFYRAQAEIEIKNYVTAIDDLSKFISTNSKNGEAYFWRAYAQYELGIQPKQKHAKKYLNSALSDLNLAIKYKVREEEAYFDRAEVKFELEDYEGAITDFKRVITLNSKNMDARYQKAFCYYHYGKEYYAEKELKQIIKIDPSYVDAYYDLAVIYLSKDKLETALSYINKCIKLDQEHGDAYEIRAEINYDLGKTDAACEDIKKADNLGDELAHKEVHKFCK